MSTRTTITTSTSTRARLTTDSRNRSTSSSSPRIIIIIRRAAYINHRLLETRSYNLDTNYNANYNRNGEGKKGWHELCCTTAARIRTFRRGCGNDKKLRSEQPRRIRKPGPFSRRVNPQRLVIQVWPGSTFIETDYAVNEGFTSGRL